MNKNISTKGVLLAAALFLGILFIGCEKKAPVEEPKTNGVKEYQLSRKTNYGNDWIYFSFATGKEISGITEENRLERLDWDIAFNRANFRTNSGVAGKGKGGALDTGSKDFGAIKSVTATNYVVDDSIAITLNVSSFPPPSINTPGNKALGKAIAFSGPPPVYTISENVFIVKTAAGKPVKFLITSFHNAKGESGYTSFKYEILQ